MIAEDQLSPATPLASLPRAAIVPETWVPCPLPSWGCASWSTKSQPWTSSMRPLPSSSRPLVSRPAPDSPGFVHRLAARSGWDASIPVSTTATVTCAEPVVTSHASGARMAVMSHS